MPPVNVHLLSVYRHHLPALQTALHHLHRQTHLHLARQSAPPRTFDFGKPPPPPHSAMGNARNRGPHSEETILFLFLAFGILIVLILIFLLLGFQIYLSHRIAGVLIEGEDDDIDRKDFRRWDRKRKERKKALRALEKARSGGGSGRGSWGYESGRPRSDEEVGMSGARGNSMVLDKFSVKEGKKAFWNPKRWI